MRKFNKIFSLLLAMILVLGFTSPVLNAAEVDNTENAKTKSVTLHKLLMTKEELQNWNSAEIEKAGYNGTQDLEGLKKLSSKNDLKEISGVYFAWQKKDNAEWKYIDKEGNVLAQQPTELTKEGFKDVFGLETTESGAKFDLSEKLAQDKNGTEYRIVEIKELSTYKNADGSILADSKAVPVYITLPLVNNDGVVQNAHVYPKNTEDKPKIDKNFATDNSLKDAEKNENITGGADYNKYAENKPKATAEIGQKIPYEVKTLISAGTEYNKLVWNDIMSNGLTYNKDFEIKSNNEDLELTKGVDYKLFEDDRGFNLFLTQTGLDKVSKITKPVDEKGISTGQGKDVEFTLTYSATVNGNAVVDKADKNNITLDYGNKPGKEIDEKEVKPKDSTIQVKKSWSEEPAPEGVNVTYTLKEGDNVVASVSLNGSEKVGDKFSVGKDIVFEVTGKYEGKFTGLEDSKTYKVSERVSGYTPTSVPNEENGEIAFTNTKDNENPTPLKPTGPEVVTFGKKFVKTDSAAKESAIRLAGAEFFVKNGEGKYLSRKTDAATEREAELVKSTKQKLDEAVKTYNALTAEQQNADAKKLVDEAQKAYNDAVIAANNAFEWVESKEGENVVLLVSDAQGRFEIRGLAKGTYKLEEKTAPSGYAKRDDVEFSVGSGTHLGQDTENELQYNPETNVDGYGQRVVNKKISIPQTGGIGTAIFAVAGILMMGGAAFAMKKNNKEEE